MAYEAGLAGAVTCFTGMQRRDFIATFAVAMAATAAWGAQEGQEMYGQIGKLIAAPGKRDELIANILGGVGSMPAASAMWSRKMRATLTPSGFPKFGTARPAMMRRCRFVR